MIKELIIEKINSQDFWAVDSIIEVYAVTDPLVMVKYHLYKEILFNRSLTEEGGNNLPTRNRLLPYKNLDENKTISFKTDSAVLAKLINDGKSKIAREIIRKSENPIPILKELHEFNIYKLYMRRFPESGHILRIDLISRIDDRGTNRRETRSKSALRPRGKRSVSRNRVKFHDQIEYSRTIPFHSKEAYDVLLNDAFISFIEKKFQVVIDVSKEINDSSGKIRVSGEKRNVLLGILTILQLWSEKQIFPMKIKIKSDNDIYISPDNVEKFIGFMVENNVFLTQLKGSYSLSTWSMESVCTANQNLEEFLNK